MTTADPKDMERQLMTVNSQRVNASSPVLEYFIPYMFLQQQPLLYDKDDELLPDNDQRVPDEAQRNNEMRKELRRFVFIRTSLLDIQQMAYADWNRFSRSRMAFYRTASGKPITVPEKMMQRFITMCLDQREKFELHPHDSQIGLGTEVVIQRGAFKNIKAHIVDVRHSTKGIRLTLSLEFFGKSRDLHLRDYTTADVLFSDDSTVVTNRHIIERVQDSLLDILSRRINHKETPESRQQDMRTLDQLYYYRHIQIDNQVMLARYRAMMLVCAALRYDSEGKTIYNKQARQFLNELSLQPATDKKVLAAQVSLLIALNISTGDPVYRDEAKQLVLKQLPDNKPLRRFISLIRR